MQLLKRVLVILYIALVLLLAAATFMEQAKGTDFIGHTVYHTAWFCCLWGVVALLASVYIVRRMLWRQIPSLLFHGSLLVILAGAMITFVTSSKGHLHLRPGVGESSFVEEESRRALPLPFVMRLDSFRVEHYPGTEAPADYVSYVTCLTKDAEVLFPQQRISMNRIFASHGYRFYQSSFDEDNQGSWLTVNHDPYGTPVTYAGYLLLGLSMLLLLVARRGEFRRLLRHPLLRRGGLFLLLLGCWGMGGGVVHARSLPALKRSQADSLARVQVIYHDRVVPFNTLARDFVQKLTGRTTYGGLTPEQVIGGWLLRPDAWREEPMIEVKSAELRSRLGLSSSHVRLSELFDGTEYRLQKLWQNEQGTNSPLAKAIREVDEKVGLVLMLQNGTLIRPLPEDGSVPSLSSWKLEAELLYNRIPFSKLLFRTNLTLGVLAFLWLFYGSLHRPSPVGERKEVRWIRSFFSLSLLLSLLFHLFGYLLRWYISGRIPLSNGYETMQFMALCILLLACLLCRRFLFVVPFGFLLSGFALLVAYLGQMNPQITPLMPVLVSPWLSFHVSLIMMSYSLLAFILLNGVLALCCCRGKRGITLLRDERVRQLTLLSRLLLYPALFFLGAGIFVGAVWANVSWGRYWAWDPKEVWALITFMVYGAAFHRHSLHRFRHPLFFHTYMVLAFLTVLMTYFGVNYLLGGMHSYANG